MQLKMRLTKVSLEKTFHGAMEISDEIVTSEGVNTHFLTSKFDLGKY